MKSPAAGTVDMRAFRWRADALLRKLQVQRELACAALAVAGREALQRQRRVDEGERACQAFLDWAARSSAHRPDPVAMSHGLAHLSRLADQLAEARTQVQDCHQREQHAREGCLEADRQLSCVTKMRDAAAAEHALQQLRSCAREADHLWLARGARR